MSCSRCNVMNVRFPAILLKNSVLVGMKKPIAV